MKELVQQLLYSLPANIRTAHVRHELISMYQDRTKMSTAQQKQFCIDLIQNNMSILKKARKEALELRAYELDDAIVENLEYWNDLRQIAKRL